MILPIVAYGNPILRKVANNIDASYPNLEQLIADMWETMYASNGVGLAAPQINRDIRLFVVDSKQIYDNMDPDERKEYYDEDGIKQVFINPKVIELKGSRWAYNEGCLSIPKIREDVFREEEVTIEFLDEQFQPHRETYHSLNARVILHEYDHIEGKLFIDHIKPLRKKLLKSKLDDISKGRVRVDYKMMFNK